MADQVVEDGRIVGAAAGDVEIRFHQTQGVIGYVGERVENSDDIAIADDTHTGHLFGLAGIGALQPGSQHRRAHQARVKQAGQQGVGGVLRLARHLDNRVFSLRRLALDAPLSGGLGPGTLYVPFDAFAAASSP